MINFKSINVILFSKRGDTMYKIGLSTTGKELEPKLFEDAKNAGIDCFEVSRRYDGYDNLDYQGLRKMADDYGIKLWSFHLPFKPFDFIDISTTDKEWRKKSFYYIFFYTNGLSINLGYFTSLGST